MTKEQAGKLVLRAIELGRIYPTHAAANVWELALQEHAFLYGSGEKVPIGLVTHPEKTRDV